MTSLRQISRGPCEHCSDPSAYFNELGCVSCKNPSASQSEKLSPQWVLEYLARDARSKMHRTGKAHVVHISAEARREERLRKRRERRAQGFNA